jgi:NDP-4-keto-2,6-dideoxyhexose 3-C-methyltransferase
VNRLYTTIRACRICKSSDLIDVISLGSQALSGCFPANNAPDPQTAPLDLVRCQRCGLVQLTHSVDPSLLYTSNYGYRSGINDTMRKHLSGIATELINRFEPGPGSLVLDIGCNDGTLLANYPSTLTRLGIDPLAEKFRSIHPAGIITEAQIFSAHAFNTLAANKKAAIITSIAMFYDLEDPNEFVSDIAHSLDHNGVWVLEQSYMPEMLRNNSYDTICHEHLEYYALSQIEWLAEHSGLRVFDADLNDANGGSSRLYVCHRKAPFAPTKRLMDLRIEEASNGLQLQATYNAFRERCTQLRDELCSFIQAEVSRKKRIHIYGASTKGNTILQYCGLDHSLIEAAADRNPEKSGARTPGTNIPIIPETEARNMKPDFFLALPWHFRKEFLQREREFLSRGGKFIFPLPALEVVSAG